MEALLLLVQKLKQNFDINHVLFEIFSDAQLQKEMIEKITIDQWFNEGVSKENVVIGYYSPYTEKINPDKKAYTHYTLIDTGQLAESLFLDVDEFEGCIVIDAKGQDNENLVYKFSGQANSSIIGFTEENMKWLIDRIKPMLLEKLNQ